MPDSSKLRELVSWYRDFAERTANPMIWEARLHTAEDLEAEADRIDGSADDFADRSEAIAMWDNDPNPHDPRVSTTA
jgi:hypothetical protein